MRKHFLLISTILFGILICFASCKNNKNNRADDEDDEDDIEAVDEDLDDEIDEDDDVVPDDTYGDFANIKTMEDLKNIDVDAVSSEDAENLLKFATKLASNELPSKMDEGMDIVAMALEGDDLSFHVKVDEVSSGMPFDALKQALEMPEMRQSITAAMSQDADADMATFMKIIKKSGKNFAIKFVSDKSGDMAVLRITNDELNQMIK